MCLFHPAIQINIYTKGGNAVLIPPYESNQYLHKKGGNDVLIPPYDSLFVDLGKHAIPLLGGAGVG